MLTLIIKNQLMNKLLRKIILSLILFGCFHMSGQTTSIMTFNIRYDNPKDNENSWNKRKNEVINLIEYYHPDFLGIQEGLHNQIDYIQKNTSNYDYIGIGRDDGNKKGEYSAIYYDSTKFKLITQKTFWLSNSPDTISIGWDASMERICTYGKFKDKITNDSIHIFNTHFDHIGIEARKMSAKLILTKIIDYKLSEANVVVMGDLNSVPTSDPITILRKELDFGFEVSENKFYGPEGTFNGFENTLEIKNRIDYIFTKNLKILSYRHIDDKRLNNLCISDHLPVLIEIKNETETIKDDLAILNLEFDGSIPIKEKIKMTLYETTNTKQHIYEARIKRRGGYSISFPKHSFEIDLEQDISLSGLPNDDDWILNASYIDKTFLRNVLSYEIFSAMGKNNITSKCQFVEVEINSEYNGLYVLMEKLDKSSLKLIDTDSLATIFKEPHIFRETYDEIASQNSTNFHQQTYPKIEKSDKRAYIEGVRDFILNSSDDEFKNELSSVFDFNNVIDWHLLLLISNNSDGILKNFYLYKVDNETPIRFAPWDYDHSFGRDGDNELNLDARPLNIERSILFKRLLKFDWYKTALKQKWRNLNKENILSLDGLKQRVLMKSEIIRVSAMKNFKTWSIDNPRYYDSNNFDEEVDIMLDFMKLRHDRLTKYFDNLN